jgi:hypothetical protein
MDKRREIPAAKPNAAPRADVDRVLRRIEQLGVDGEDAVEAAGMSRPTYFRLRRYEASVGSLRKLDEWAAREEGKRKKPGTPSGTEQDALLAEWAALGEQLLEADPGRFRTTLDGLRDVLESVKLTQRAFSKMFRATPDHER